MTVTDEPTVDTREDDPQHDEGEAVAVELVKSGWVRLRWGGTLVRLRRPFFGELKTIRLALEDAADEIADRSEKIQSIGRKLIEESQKNEEEDGRSDEERAKVRADLTRQSKHAARELTDFGEEQRIGWWRLVVGLVGVDGELPPDDRLPSWIADPSLPNTVLQHWRAVPLGRG